jgi:hypothetical protein
MMFFFKNKEIHIDCFTERTDVYDYFPIDYSQKFFPEWWKRLPKILPPNAEKRWNHSTMKGCVGFNLFYTNSLTIPLWTDMLISKDEKGFVVDFSDRETKGGSHDVEQMGSYINPNDFAQFKIISPWLFYCKEDVEWTWTQPTWNFPVMDQITIPPGVIDYKYQHGTNINIFFRNGQKILIESGQPMVNIRPLSERKLKLHTHLVDNSVIKKIARRNSSISFTGKYNKIKQIMKKKESEKKCPFHF